MKAALPLLALSLVTASGGALGACTGGPGDPTTGSSTTDPAPTTSATATSSASATASTPAVQCNAFPGCPENTHSVGSAASACPASPATCEPVTACGHTVYCASN